jgi:serine/threonine protein kinase
VTAGETDLVGQTVEGKYRVETLLGRGGMGAVYRAVHLGTGRVVALKVIAPSLAGQPEYLARFSREARACGRLRHPGIVDVTDFGVATHEGRPRRGRIAAPHHAHPGGSICPALTVSSVVGSLIYLSARRANGESMDQIWDRMKG